MTILLSIAAIVATLVIGFKKKINIGLVGTVFAFVIGCFFCDLSPRQVYGFLPVNVLFKVVPITLFYGYALENGTLYKLVDKVLFVMSRWIWFIPCATFILCVLLGMSGIGAGSLSSILAPIIMAFASLADLNVLVCCLALAYGSAIGSCFVTSEGGTTSISIIEQTPYGADALSIGLKSWLHIIIVFVIVFVVYFISVKAYRQKNNSREMKKPEPFTPVQRKNLILIGVVVFLLVGPLLLYLLFPSPTTEYIYKKLDLGFVMLLGALTASLLKLGDVSTVVRSRIPWNTIFVVSGMTILIGVATEAGLTGAIASLINKYLPKFLVAPVMALTAGLLSCFCSVVSVVLPSLYPLVDGLSSASGVAPELLFCAILTGASITGVSPFSTGGSLILSCCTDEKKRDELVPKMIGLALMGILAVVVFYLLIQLI